MNLQSVIESLIFAADKPLTKRQLRGLTGAEKEDIDPCLEALREAYEDRGVQLVETGGGFQFRTHPENGDWVRKLLAGRPVRLTRAMLEVLSIIAYRQPVTRPEVEEIRGVDCGSTLRVLLERDLIRIVGKKEEPGRPLIYGTTKYFLEFFNLKDLRELPSLKEFTELTDEHKKHVDEQFGGGPPTIVEQDDEQGEEGETFAVGTVHAGPELDEEAERAMDALDAAMDKVADVLDAGDPKKQAAAAAAAAAAEPANDDEDNAEPTPAAESAARETAAPNVGAEGEA
ncbi:MAG: SMC-Scp complex subunit ScpB [Myxococcales bacterium]|nr:SMC-Scp complex subunit ScpB [Myxococcales bacterium]